MELFYSIEPEKYDRRVCFVLELVPHKIKG